VPAVVAKELVVIVGRPLKVTANLAPDTPARLAAVKAWSVTNVTGFSMLIIVPASTLALAGIEALCLIRTLAFATPLGLQLQGVVPSFDHKLLFTFQVALPRV